MKELTVEDEREKKYAAARARQKSIAAVAAAARAAGMTYGEYVNRTPEDELPKPAAAEPDEKEERATKDE